VACTGLHGANRLASNSLLEGLVFGQRAIETAAAEMAQVKTPTAHADWDPGTAVDSDESVMVTHNWEELRRLMWNYVGIVRSDKRLSRARRRLSVLRDEIREYYWNYLVTSDLLELRNIADVAELIITSAAFRRESRGLHYNVDHPQPDERYRADTVLRGGALPAQRTTPR
jgi:L-aspartate oxidase